MVRRGRGLGVISWQFGPREGKFQKEKEAIVVGCWVGHSLVRTIPSGRLK